MPITIVLIDETNWYEKGVDFGNPLFLGGFWAALRGFGDQRTTPKFSDLAETAKFYLACLQ